MRFVEVGLPGAWIVELTPSSDARGSFARTFCEREFAARGLERRFVQTNLSRTAPRHTLRGMHYQVGDAAEVKLVQCLRGRILDTILDVRAGSPTFGRHVQVELGEGHDRLLYVPRGFAHGFLTLSGDCVVTYQVSSPYTPDAERGVRWDDPAFAIPWPVAAPILSDKDARWPLWERVTP